MIDFYFWPTPNGHKVTLMLEEAGIEYRFVPVDISAGEQFKPIFLAFSPNNRMPAIIDHAPADGGEAVPVFESGAILLYLAEKCGRFLPADMRGRKTVLEWLFWQMGGLGPMAGQNQHFAVYAPERIPAAMDRHADRASREEDRAALVAERRHSMHNPQLDWVQRLSARTARHRTGSAEPEATLMEHDELSS